MKISMECDVEGRVQIGSTIRTVIGSKEYILKHDSAGFLKTISINKSVNKPEKYARRLERKPNSNEKILRINRDIEEYNEMRKEFQELESLLSFETHGSIKSITWDSPMEVWIPETDEEQERIRISGIKQTKQPPDLVKRLNAEQFEQILSTKGNYVSLILPKMFFKEGLNEFYSKRYINAYYNFYFILEDIYGEGKTKNRDIANAFKKSKDFNVILQRMISKTIGYEKKYEINLKKLCAEEKEDFNVEGLLNLIWKIRGNLHHYSSRSTKHLGTPFNHEDFESIAFLTMGIAYQTILSKIEDIDKLKNEIEKQY
jgi:hypothetical protein